MRPYSLLAALLLCAVPAIGGTPPVAEATSAGPTARPAGVTTASARAFEPMVNPFGYAVEYRDPTWGGSYLRARWFHPGLPSFTGRDPAGQQLNHYGYGGGNPLMHVDPSGRSFRGFARELTQSLDKINAGVGGHFARFFVGPIIGPLQILANPKAFWQAIEHDRGGMTVFLAGGLAAEAASSIWVTQELNWAPLRFSHRVGGEAVLGTLQSVFASLGHGGRRFNADSFTQGLEYTFGIEFVDRIAGGIGYQPYDLHGWYAGRALTARSADLQPQEAAIFRLREPPLSHLGGVNWTTPWQERWNLGLYHERIIAITRDAVYATDVGPWGRIQAEYLADQWLMETNSTLRSEGGGPAIRYQYLGTVGDFDQGRFFRNRRGFSTEQQVEERGAPSGYDAWRNNSHHHVASIREALGVR